MNTKRIEQIQEETAHPESGSVQQALLKVWNETEQDKRHQTPEADVRLNNLLSDTDYAYSTIAEYEEITGLSVNEAFRIGWDMARVTNKQLSEL